MFLLSCALPRTWNNEPQDDVLRTGDRRWIPTFLFSPFPARLAGYFRPSTPKAGKTALAINWNPEEIEQADCYLCEYFVKGMIILA